MATKSNSRSLVTLSERAVIDSLAESVTGMSATFYCGGNIPVTADQAEKVRVYFEKLNDDTSACFDVVHLPHDQTQGASMEDLASACEEATFGKAGQPEDVLDPSYRKALKLEPGAFACSFHPAEEGILNAIQQVMMTNGNYVRAELHKLNVYREGDFFKAHVDTPRGPEMFGSLVVCLPSVHEGGNLIIKHGKQIVNVDWSEKSAEHIQWVALYSDCQHEVKEVVSGNRVTLTYNLYADPPGPDPERGRLTPPLIKLRDTVFYRTFVRALGVQSFMHDGGILGLTLQHKYAHVSSAFAARPAAMLKGADAVILAVANQLELKTGIIHQYGEACWDSYDVDLDDIRTLDGHGVRGVNVHQITWCINEGHDILLKNDKPDDCDEDPGKYYGNQGCTEVDFSYCVAALLVFVPEWGAERGKILRGSSVDP